MPRYRCYRCGQAPKFLEFEDSSPKCPKCGSVGEPAIVELRTIHFMVMGSGPITGHFGAQHIACEPDRPYLARHYHDDFAASDLPPVVNCRKCMETKAFKEMAKLFVEMPRAAESYTTTYESARVCDHAGN